MNFKSDYAFVFENIILPFEKVYLIKNDDYKYYFYFGTNEDNNFVEIECFDNPTISEQLDKYLAWLEVKNKITQTINNDNRKSNTSWNNYSIFGNKK